MVWGRRLSVTMGDQEEFKKALKETFADPDLLTFFKQVFKSVIKEDMDDLRKEIGTLRDVIKAKDTKIDNLQTKVLNLETTVDNLEQYSRRNSIRISGVPELEHEDVPDRVLDLFNHKMGVSTQIVDIDRMHRVGKRGTDRPRAILVKFATYRARESVFKAKRYLKPGAERPLRNAPAWNLGHATGLAPEETEDPAQDAVIPEPREAFSQVFLSEDLTEVRQSLLFQCRQARRAGKLMDCWSYDGLVTIKDVAGLIKRVKTVVELSQLCDAVDPAAAAAVINGRS